MTNCLNCRQYCNESELDAFYECYKCRILFLNQMKELGADTIKKEPIQIKPITHDIDYILHTLEDEGIYKGAEKLDVSVHNLKNHLKKYDININDFSKKKGATDLKEILDKLNDDNLKKELADLGITKMFKKYKTTHETLRKYLTQRSI